MAEHSIFYYPYASFREAQAPLLKAAALYFDRLYVLDPVKASWRTIGPGPVEHDLRLLEEAGILVRVSPEEVLLEHERGIAETVRADLADPAFVDLCEAYGAHDRWTLALAKIPHELRDDPAFAPRDRSMQRLMGEVARQGSGEVSRYREHAVYGAYAEGGAPYDEYREVMDGVVEYRYADLPVAVGEAIMVNHALFGGLLHTGATPLTDDPFHHRVLAHKIDRARRLPEVRQVLDDRAQQRRLKRDRLAAEVLTDVDLAVLPPEMPLEEILAYRERHEDDLRAAREELAWVAREVRQRPWDDDFAGALESEALPAVRRKLVEARKARDGWVTSARGKLALKAAGIAAGAAATTITLALSATPLLPIAVVTGALGLVGGSVIPLAEVVRDWREGRAEATENGLHYLLNVR